MHIRYSPMKCRHLNFSYFFAVSSDNSLPPALLAAVACSSLAAAIIRGGAMGGEREERELRTQVIMPGKKAGVRGDASCKQRDAAKTRRKPRRQLVIRSST